jgi:hypothetical protein
MRSTVLSNRVLSRDAAPSRVAWYCKRARQVVQRQVVRPTERMKTGKTISEGGSDVSNKLGRDVTRNVARMSLAKIRGCKRLRVGGVQRWLREWLGRRDSNPNNLLQRQVSYR